jgi:hypothetical protein
VPLLERPTLIDTTSVPRPFGLRVQGAATLRDVGDHVSWLLPGPLPRRIQWSEDGQWAAGSHAEADASRTRVTSARTCGLDDVAPTCRNPSFGAECVPSLMWPGSACRLTSAALDRARLFYRGGGTRWVDDEAVQSVVRGLAVNRGGIVAVLYEALVKDTDGGNMVTRIAFFRLAAGGIEALGRVEVQGRAALDHWPYVWHENHTMGGHYAGHVYPMTTPGPNDDNAFVMVVPLIDTTAGPVDTLVMSGTIDTARRSIMELVRVRVPSRDKGT